MEEAAILLVEDDGELRELVRRGLCGYGFAVDCAENGDELFKKTAAKSYALIILDVMLPGEDGLGLCRRLRDSARNNPDIPIIFTSALGEESDRVVGLEMGGDDYLPKPFSMRELVARIRAVLRRAQGGKAANAAQKLAEKPEKRIRQIAFGKWRLDLLSCCLVGEDGVALALSKTEFTLLNFLLNNPRQVLSREQIIEHMGNIETYDRNVDVQINRLRNKLGDRDNKNGLIRTVRGMGYMLEADIENIAHES